MSQARREFQLVLPYPGPKGALTAFEIVVRSRLGLPWYPAMSHAKDPQATIRFEIAANEDDLAVVAHEFFSLFTNDHSLTVLDVNNRLELSFARSHRARRTGDDR